MIFGSSIVANCVGFVATQRHRKLFGRAPSIIRTETKVRVQTQSKEYQCNPVRNSFVAYSSDPFNIGIWEHNRRLIESELGLTPRPLSHCIVPPFLLALARSYGPDDIANLVLHIESSANSVICSPYTQRSLEYTAAP